MSLDYATDVSAYAIADAGHAHPVPIAPRTVSTAQDDARRIFANAGFRLEVRPLAIFSLWQATWTDDAGTVLGMIIGPSAERTAQAAVAKLAASPRGMPPPADMVVLAR